MSIMDNPLKASARLITCRTIVLMLVMSVCTRAQQCPWPCSCSTPGYVYCGHLGLTSAPTGYPVNTTQLYLDNNQLSSLPVGIFNNQTHLTHLYLYRNQISSFQGNEF
eukprot:scpid83824/ scgid14317/ Leucine-rich repeat transmembrane protein FLRT3; Fibronectin-like domain-containing leucine-rich transmembrane protein 3